MYIFIVLDWWVFPGKNKITEEYIKDIFKVANGCNIAKSLLANTNDL